jgi:hypothetical protein
MVADRTDDLKNLSVLLQYSIPLFSPRVQRAIAHGGVLLTAFWIACICVFKYAVSRAIAQAVSHWLPNMAAQVQAQVWSSGICGGQRGTEAGFPLVLWFPQPIFIPPNSPVS